MNTRMKAVMSNNWETTRQMFQFLQQINCKGKKKKMRGKVPGAGILHIECSTFHSIIFQDLE